MFFLLHRTMITIKFFNFLRLPAAALAFKWSGIINIKHMYLFSEKLFIPWKEVDVWVKKIKNTFHSRLSEVFSSVSLRWVSSMASLLLQFNCCFCNRVSLTIFTLTSPGGFFLRHWYFFEKFTFFFFLKNYNLLSLIAGAVVPLAKIMLIADAP